MSATYSALQTVSVGAGGQASIQFINIPSIYQDLAIRWSARSSFNAGPSAPWDTFNTTLTGATSIGYIYAGMTGDATRLSPDGKTTGSIFAGSANGSNSSSSFFSNCEIYITNYAGTQPKMFSTQSATFNSNLQAFWFIASGAASGSTPITDITLAGSGTIQQHSIFTLYGIKKF